MQHIAPLLTSHPHRPLCLSGGAPGADHLWCLAALSASHFLIHWTFPTHRSPCSPSHCIPLSDADLELAVPAVTHAASVLGKTPPVNKHTWRLVHRDWYQVRWAGSCYGVTVMPGGDLRGKDGGEGGDGDGRVEKGHRVGGTAWAMTMFAAMNAEGGERRMWVFCQERGRWLRWGGDAEGRVWEECRVEEVPRPEGVWAGVGSRRLTEGGRRAIREVMGVGVGVVLEGDGEGEEGEKRGEEEGKEGKGEKQGEEGVGKGRKSRRKMNRKARVAERNAEQADGRNSAVPES